MDYTHLIEEATAHYKSLLEEQLRRQTRMETASPAKDFTRAERIVVGLVPGDGIGPIIMEQAERVLRRLLADDLASGRVELRAISGLTIENRLSLGRALPEDTLSAMKQCDVLLKGPTPTPKGGTLESANVALRRELDLYANVRPVCVPAEGIDWGGQECCIIGWGSPFDADDHTYKVFGTDKGANYSGYSNAQVDEALTKARQTDDPAERAAAYAEFQQALAAAPAYTFFCYIDAIYVAADKIQGITPDTVLGHHGVGIFWNICDWTV